MKLPLEKLKPITDSKELLSCLKALKQERHEILIWQTNSSKNRIIQKGLITFLDGENNEMEIAPVDTDKPFQFDKQLPLFFHGPKRDLIFKQDKIKFLKTHLIMDLPQTARALDLREGARLKLDEDQEILSQVIINPSNINSKKQTELRLFDISKEGLGLVFPVPFLKHIFDGEKIIIEKVGEYTFEKSLEGTIQYVTRIELSKSGNRLTYGKIGIKLDSSFPDKFYQNSILAGLDW